MAAGLLVVGVAATVWWGIQQEQAALGSRNREFQTLKSQLETSRTIAQQSASGNFTLALPLTAQSDDIVRDMSRLAGSLGVQIASLTVQMQQASTRELGQIQYHLAMNADYRATKSWLAHLLGRYAALSIQTLTVRAIPNDPARQEVRVTLVLFVKD